MPAVLPKAEERPTLSVEEVAHWLGIGRTAAYDAVGRGDIPSIRIGNRIKVPTAALRQMLKLYG